MLDWIIETLGMLFSGANQLLTALLRIGLIALGCWGAWRYIKALLDKPSTVLRITAGIGAALIIGFGSILIVPKFIPIHGAFFTIVIWIGGWFVAYYAAKIIMGLSEDDEPSDQ